MKEIYLNVMILVVVSTGTALVAFAGNASQGGPLQSVFMAFLAAIIVVQVVPAVMMLVTLIKSLRHRSEKAVEHQPLN